MFKAKGDCQPIIYWLIWLTWGGIMTIPGLIALIVLSPRINKIHKNGYGLIAEIGGNWGGISFGPISFCGNYSVQSHNFFEHTRKHEFGHALQLLLMGPFFLFIIGIPSLVRATYRKYTKRTDLPEYDAIWFEGTATKWGSEFIEELERIKVRD